MTATLHRAGDFRPVPGKRCRQCGCAGEWPGPLCPDCTATPQPPAAPASHTPPASAGGRLEQLAAIVNDEHNRVTLAGREIIEHAIRCGRALLEAQAQLARGQWLDWLETKVTIHPTTAYRYMRIAEHEQEVRKSGVESIEHALRLLAEHPRRGQGPRGYSAADKAQWIALVDQVGVKRTAKLLGVSPSTVWKWASPNSPERGKHTDQRGSAVTDEMVDRLAVWLVDKFGDLGYHVRVSAEARADARTALEHAFGEDE